MYAFYFIAIKAKYNAEKPYFHTFTIMNFNRMNVLASILQKKTIAKLFSVFFQIKIQVVVERIKASATTLKGERSGAACRPIAEP